MVRVGLGWGWGFQITNSIVISHNLRNSQKHSFFGFYSRPVRQNINFLPKHNYYRSLKNRPKRPQYRPEKIEKIAGKKIVRNFLKNIKILIFFKFFKKTVLKTLLRGGETVRKNYGIVFEKISKIMFFYRKNRWKKIVRNFLIFLFSSFSQNLS